MSLLVDIKKKLGNFSLDVSFETDDSVLALLGASGCGKSMTLKCIAGIVNPDSGVIIADGRTLFDSKRRINLRPQQRDVGLLFQNYALFPNMTVEENIRTVLSRREKERDITAIMNSLLDRFFMQGLGSHYPAQLSGGQQQRAALARIMASRPSLMMLDEPLSALDSYLRWQLELEIIDTLEDFSGTTVYVSHNRDEVYRLCDFVCPMSEGQAHRVYDVKTLFSAPDSFAACLLSGCKNYSRAAMISADRVTALDWGATLTCAAAADDTNRIGVRAHFIRKATGKESENVIPCRVVRVIENVFGVIVTAHPRGAADPKRSIRMELSHDLDWAKELAQGEPIDLYIAPEDIILLSR